MLDRVMKFTMLHIFIIGLLALMVGAGSMAGFLYRVGFKSEGLLVRVGGGQEGFRNDDSDAPVCGKCKKTRPCGCSKSDSEYDSDSEPESRSKSKSKSESRSESKSGYMFSSKPVCPPVAPCPRVIEPDLSKYILKSQVPSTHTSIMPDMSNYMLKTECPAVPDLSKYVLKSSIPKPQPVIIDNSSCKKDAGECPPCPRPRCPVVTCPPPTKCPPPAPCPRPVCPPTVVKCKSEEVVNNSTVRPFLAPLNMSGFGSA